MLSAHVRNRGTRKDGSAVWQARYREPGNSARWYEKTFRRKADAEKWLRAQLKAVDDQVWERPQTKTGITFAQACDEWLHWLQHVRAVKPSTLSDCRLTVAAYLKPAFGALPVEKITTKMITDWRDTVAPAQRQTLSPRSKNKLVITVNGVFVRAMKNHRLTVNPVKDVERLTEPPAADLSVFSPDEVWALVRAAERGEHRYARTPAGGVHSTPAAQQRRKAEDQLDAALYLTAAFTGLRMGELLALRWREVDFAASTVRVVRSYSAGTVTMPKSKKVRSVPLVAEVATALAKLGQRPEQTGDDDLVFTIDGRHLDNSALRRRYKRALVAAELRELRFHDLRHTFGTLAIKRASVLQVQAWMGHADIQTTMGYLHYVDRGDEATLLAGAFAAAEPSAAVVTLTA